MITFLLCVLAIAAFIVIGQTDIKKRRKRETEIWKRAGNEPQQGIRRAYADKFWLLNKTELELLNRLQTAMPRMLVFSQVSMSQIFYFTGQRRDTYVKLGEIGRKSIDFLICRRDTSIVVAIELNGPTHDRPEQQRSDEKKWAALREAGIPLMIYTPEALPDIDTIKKTIAPLIVERRAYEAERRKRWQERKH